MGKVTILEGTTKNPITVIGERAGVCYGSDILDPSKNYKRGMDCILSNHGRTLEFPRVELVLDGYSARAIREWYTHIGCLPTRLQASTRYIDYSKGFKYIIPPTINDNEEAFNVYVDMMNDIQTSLCKLKELGIPKEDLANGLPLGMQTRIVDSRNLRNLIDMSHQRECRRAYWEFRVMFNDIKKSLSEYSEEWKWIVDNLFMPKCKFLGKCTEARPCYKQKK